jgi:Fe-Mn family superoxide dismutase
MKHELHALPYDMEALAPTISKETLEFHWGKHHRTYVENLNKLIEGTPFASSSLEDIIRRAEGGIFNNGAQVWNHTFYWNSLHPSKSGPQKPEGKLLDAIQKDFGSYDTFKEQFSKAAIGQFGSGWAWLVKDTAGKLAIVATPNAENPLRQGKTPILTCDVWEHAYYIDYRNARAKYVEGFWNLCNWDFAKKNFER